MTPVNPQETNKKGYGTLTLDVDLGEWTLKMTLTPYLYLDQTRVWYKSYDSNSRTSSFTINLTNPNHTLKIYTMDSAN